MEKLKYLLLGHHLSSPFLFDIWTAIGSKSPMSDVHMLL